MSYIADTNLLDWSDTNLIAVALFQSAYVWNADSKDCQRIEIHFPESYNYISALSWSPRDKVLAISDNDGEITVLFFCIFPLLFVAVETLV